MSGLCRSFPIKTFVLPAVFGIALLIQPVNTKTMEPTTATLLTTGISAAAQGANMMFQGNMNRKNRKFALQQYYRQRDDELKFWRMNNAYNHPTAQMERLRAAGLNPHLVYGNGAIGNSSSAASAPTQARWEGRPLQMDPNFAAQGLDLYFNIEAKKAQTDNLREQNTLLEKEALLKDIAALQASVNLEKTKFDLGVDYDIRKALVDQAYANVLDTQARTALNITQEEKARLDSFISVILTGDKLENTKLERELSAQNIDAQKLKNRILNVQADLWDKGINPSDPTWLRVIAQILESAGVMDMIRNGKVGIPENSVIRPSQQEREWRKPGTRTPHRFGEW
ncbi:MAG: hypothetical protein QXJ97_10640 [Desulfurococcaceae archaeon]